MHGTDTLNKQINRCGSWNVYRFDHIRWNHRLKRNTQRKATIVHILCQRHHNQLPPVRNAKGKQRPSRYTTNEIKTLPEPVFTWTTWNFTPHRTRSLILAPLDPQARLENNRSHAEPTTCQRAAMIFEPPPAIQRDPLVMKAN
jgi:hypothetical protein